MAVRTAAEMPASPVSAEDELGERAARTRQAILDASRQLFLDKGYAGTRINNITDACDISRAGFYTYFKDKRAVFSVLGETVYADILKIVGEWETISQEPSLEEMTAWVRDYYAFMDLNGAFIYAANQAPFEDELRASARRMQMRVAFLLGVSLRARQSSPTPAPEALGLTVIAMLDHTWYLTRVQLLPVSDEDMVNSAAHTLFDILKGPDHDA